MKHQFVKTSNYGRFMDAVRDVEQRGAAEASMLLVYGNPGYPAWGKGMQSYIADVRALLAAHEQRLAQWDGKPTN